MNNLSKKRYGRRRRDTWASVEGYSGVEPTAELGQRVEAAACSGAKAEAAFLYACPRLTKANPLST